MVNVCECQGGVPCWIGNPKCYFFYIKPRYIREKYIQLRCEVW